MVQWTERMEDNHPASLAHLLAHLLPKESDTGLAPPSQWDLEGDKQMMKQDSPLLLWEV